MFLPTTLQELKHLGWDALDVILVTGDSYIDAPHIGVAVIGKVLLNAGFRVGIIAQPDITSKRDISRLGEPNLFWGVTAGCVDSMVANRTASGKKRRRDDYTPGGINNRRPDRATIVYTNLIRQHFKNTRPIVLGGIEASLRRIAHYDFWTDKIRRSVLFDAKADLLLYGMADRSVVQLANFLQAGKSFQAVRGLCYIAKQKPPGCLELPSFHSVENDDNAFTSMFHTFYRNNNPGTAKMLAQKQDTRYLIQTPPAQHLSEEELDAIYELEYERGLHPFHQRHGEVKALETIRFAITTHRGCFGECNFCAIGVHQGRTVRSRSPESILREAHQIAAHPLFKGTIHDVGGPTANMFGLGCSRRTKKGACPKKRCLSPDVCADLAVDHRKQISLLRRLRKVNGVRKAVVASGIRHDLVLADSTSGEEYLRELISHHISGHLKIAPEHVEPSVLNLMGKPMADSMIMFKDLFYRLTKQAKCKQFLTYYIIAAHPGSSEEDMKRVADFAKKNLGHTPEQVQVFTPTPSTYSTLMYRTERNPFTGEPCLVEKTFKGREKQKALLANVRIKRNVPSKHAYKKKPL